METLEVHSPPPGPLMRLFGEAFAASEGPDEGALIAGLVGDLLATDPADLRIFVARRGARMAGGILFTRLWFPETDGCFLLSPVAVHPDMQRQGVGQALIRTGLSALWEAGADGAFTYGDPRYYGKVGFRPISEKDAPAPLPLSQPHGWLAQARGGGVLGPLAGPSRCVPAMNRADIW